MQHRPHIEKILSEGRKAFNRWSVCQDQHALGTYQGLRFALLFIQMYDPDMANRDDATLAFRDLSTYGAELPEEEPAR